MMRAALVAALAACALLCGCEAGGSGSGSGEVLVYVDRFEVRREVGGGAYGMSVMVDRRTGVEYLRSAYGICPLYEADGSLSVDEEVAE